MELEIKVLKEHFEKAMYCGIYSGSVFESCAIALAVRDIFPRAKVYSMFLDFFGESYRQGHRTIWNGSIKTDLPREVTNQITRFDKLVSEPEKRLDLSEFSFIISVPDEVWDRIDISEVRKILCDHKNLKLIEC